jgi:hypothetical protein
MHRERIVATLAPDATSDQEIMAFASGLKKEAA